MSEAIDEFRTEGYQRHNRARLDHLASLGLDLENKTVLELGAGIGDHTGFWLKRGCKVACVEPRKENWQRLRESYPDVPILDFNLEQKMFLPTREIVYAYGILYHLRNPEWAIEHWAGVCTELLLLETCVCTGLPRTLIQKPEDRTNPTASLSGTCCRPSRNWVRTELLKHFPRVYLPTTQPDHEEFPTDWIQFEHEGIVLPPEGLIRAVFVASREPIDNPLLVEGLPQQQTRYTGGAK